MANIICPVCKHPALGRKTFGSGRSGYVHDDNVCLETRGRPAKDPDDRKTEVFSVRMTPRQGRHLDQQRGNLSRGNYLLRCWAQLDEGP